MGEGEGDVKDPLVAMASEAYLHSRSRTTPFLLLASLLQPHDICFWAIDDYTPQLVPQRIPFGELAGPLPELPPNTRSRPPEPRLIAQAPWRPKNRSDEQWRFYLYNYYRMVEMLDADVGRILDALEASGAGRRYCRAPHLRPRRRRRPPRQRAESTFPTRRRSRCR